MSVFSKFFNEALAPATCRDIVHPHTDSCFKAALGYFFKPIFTTTQFFIPLFMVSIHYLTSEVLGFTLYNQKSFATHKISIAARKNKIDQEAFAEMLRSFVGAVSASLLTGSIGTCFMCILYKIFGRFFCYTIVGFPGFLGALSIFTVPNKIAIMFTHSAFVMVTETLIRRRGSILFKLLDRVIWFRTLVFMLLSAITLDSLRKVKPDISWFIQPVRRRSKRRYENYDESPLFDSIFPVTGNVCSHKLGCDEFILNELKKYSEIGVAIALLQSTFRNFGHLKRNIFGGIWTIIKGFNLKFIVFAIGYPSVYRILTCFFNRYNGYESKFANYTAAFLAGGFFYFYPQLSFLAYGIACTIEILWQRLRRRRKFAIIRNVDELPLARIFYPILMGFLFHMRSFFPWQTPTLIHKVMKFVKCRHDEQMLMNCYSFLIPSNA